MEISQQHQEHIKQKIESGQYSSPDEVIGKALKLLDERDEALAEELADIRAKLDVAAEQSRKGQLIPARDVFDRLERRNAKRPRQ